MPHDSSESFRETAYLSRSPANALRILEAVENLEAGRGTAHDMIDGDRGIPQGRPADQPADPGHPS